MHKRGIIRYANYTVCASVYIHFCMQWKNNENIPLIIPNTLCICINFTISISVNRGVSYDSY